MTDDDDIFGNPDSESGIMGWVSLAILIFCIVTLSL